MNRIPNTILVNGKRIVCRIFQQPTVYDNYTIAFKGCRSQRGMVYPYLGCNDAPFHPQGIGYHGESERFLTGKSLGKRVRFESLPEQVQRFILQSI